MTRHVRRQRCPSLRVSTAIVSSCLTGCFAFSALLASPLAANSACEDVSGVYEVTVDVPGGGPTQIELDLSQEECTVTGFVTAQTRTPIENGVVEDATASFTFAATNEGNGSTLEIAWVITVADDDVTGTFSHDLFGSLEVTGTRASG